MSQTKISLPQKYAALFAADSRYFVITGGRSSGKSHAINTWAVMLTYEVGQRILHTRFTAVSTRDSIIADVEARIQELGVEKDFIVRQSEIVNRRSGSVIIFKGLKSASTTEKARLKSISGITTWIVEEAEDLRDEDAFDVVDLSIRGNKDCKRLRTVLVMNPTDVEHFVYRRFYLDNDVHEGWSGIKGDTCYIHSIW